MMLFVMTQPEELMKRILKKSDESLVYLGNLLQSPLLLVCRLYWGVLFMVAGWGKLLDPSRLIQLLETHHLFPAAPLAYLAAGAEFIGGICLILGFASRLAAIPLIFTMTVAYLTVHKDSLQAIFKQPHLFVADAPFNFLFVSLLIFAFGPGYFSLDHWIKKRFFHSSGV